MRSTSATGNWSIELTFYSGGFAKSADALRCFIDDLHSRHGIRLEPVYVAQLLYGLAELAAQGWFRPGARIVAVLTGQECSGT